MTGRAVAAGVLVLAMLGGCRRPPLPGYATDQRQAIRIVGEPAFFAANARAADAFAAAHTGLPAPVIEAMPARRALALVCGGTGLRWADAALIAGPLPYGALDPCRAHGVPVLSRPAATAPGAVLVINGAHLARVGGLPAFLAEYGPAPGPR